jgi:hypothetical protein
MQAVTGVGTAFQNLKPWQFIKTAGGQRLRIRSVIDGGSLYLWTNPGSTETGVTYVASTHTATGVATSFTTQLERGDFIYWDTGYAIISRVTDNSNIWLAEHPGVEFSGKTFQRSVRVKFLGGVSAGRYKCFQGYGVVRFGPNTISEVLPQWWGAVGDDNVNSAVANSDAFEKAVFSPLQILEAGGMSSGTGAKVSIGTGCYHINRHIPIPGNTWLYGQGRGTYGGIGTSIKAASNFAEGIMLYTCPGIWSYGGSIPMSVNWHISHVSLDGANRQYGGNYLHILAATSGKEGHVSDTAFFQAGWAMIFDGHTRAMISRNHIACRNGIYANGWDAWYTNNEITIGQNLAVNGTFANSSNWVWNTGWTWNAAGRADHTAGNNGSLVSSAALAYSAGECVAVKYTIANRTAGSITVTVGGVTSSLARSANGTYVEFLKPNTVDTIAFNPSVDFNGSVDDVYVYYGIGIHNKGAGNTITDNIVFGDGGAMTALLVDAGQTIAANNRLGPAGFGVMLGGYSAGQGIFTNNNLGSNFCYGVFVKNGAAGTQIVNNYIHDNLMNGFVVADGTAFTGGLLKHNTFTNNALGHLGYIGVPVANEPIMEDNYGIDLQCTFPDLPVNYTYPSVVTGKRFNVNYSSARNLTDLQQGANGKEVWLFFKNSNTSVLFSTSTTLKGNGGVDFAAQAGDVMKAVKGDDGNWYCEIISVPKPLPSQLTGTITWDPTNLSDGQGATSPNITVTGAAMGDFVLVAPPYDLQGLACSAYVSAVGTAKIRIDNKTGGSIDLPPGTWKVKVLK